MSLSRSPNPSSPEKQTVDFPVWKYVRVSWKLSAQNFGRWMWVCLPWFLLCWAIYVAAAGLGYWRHGDMPGVDNTIFNFVAIGVQYFIIAALAVSWCNAMGGKRFENGGDLQFSRRALRVIMHQSVLIFGGLIGRSLVLSIVVTVLYFLSFDMALLDQVHAPSQGDRNELSPEEIAALKKISEQEAMKLVENIPTWVLALSAVVPFGLLTPLMLMLPTEAMGIQTRYTTILARLKGNYLKLMLGGSAVMWPWLLAAGFWATPTLVETSAEGLIFQEQWIDSSLKYGLELAIKMSGALVLMTFLTLVWQIFFAKDVLEALMKQSSPKVDEDQ